MFVLAALLAGVAGWLFAHVQRYVSPAPFGLAASIEYVFMVVIGGVSQLAGAVLGAAIVVLLRDRLTEWLPRLLGSSGNFETVVFSLAVIALLHHAPRGAAPMLSGGIRRIVFGGTMRAMLPSRRPASPFRVAARRALPRRTMPTRGVPVLEVRGIEKRFGGLTAARAIELAVHAGEIVALIGPNGAGKTTMFNLISGVLARCRHRSGCRARTRRPAAALMPAGLARTFQHVRLLPAAACWRTLRLARICAAAPACARHAAARPARGSALLPTLAGRPSASALAHCHVAEPGSAAGPARSSRLPAPCAVDPRLLLLDEPAAGLRLEEKQRSPKLLRPVARRRHGVLLVEHDMDFVMGLADRVVVMDFGQKIAEGPPDACSAIPAVMEAYLGGVA